MGRSRSLLVALLAIPAFAVAAHAAARGGFDASGHLLIDGKPRFVLGVYDSGGAYSPDPAHWEDQIFSATGSRGLGGIPLNVYLNYWMGAMPIDSTTALLDVLHAHGMTYLQTGNCSGDGSWTRYGPGSFSIMSRDYVGEFARHPAALGYYTMDECADALIAETEAHDAQLHAWDPAGVTLAATVAAGYRDPAKWVGAADVLATDPYPLYGPEPASGYTHFIVGDFVSKLRAVARPNRPVWAVLQFFQFTTDSRMPTPDELRAHAVMAIVEGAQGLLWWDVGVNGLRRLPAATVSAYTGHLKNLATELAGLEPALVAEDGNTALAGNSTRFADPIAGRIAQLEHNLTVEWLYSRDDAHSRVLWYRDELAALRAGDTSKSGGMLDGAANVRTRTTIVDGVGYVFAYNYTNLPTPVTFTWHQVPTSVTESRSGQRYTLSGASWSDTFAPYGARIYVVRGAGTTPPPAPGNLAQFAGDGVTAIPAGGSVDTRTVVLAATVADPAAAVKLQVEVRPAGAAFTGVPTHEGSLLAGGGQARVTVAGLANGVDYHWQARAVNDAGAAGAWLEFAAAAQSGAARDFVVTVVSFDDVPGGQGFWTWIEALRQAGITKGCSDAPPLYCPDQGVNRGQMAVFLLRARHGSGYVPPPATGVFADVPITHPFARWIEALFAEGLAGGCATAPLRYCPDQPMTRAQMAVLLLRGEHGAGWEPPAATGVFADVPVAHPLAPWIERLAGEGVTGGCASGPARYCPDRVVTRGQMAVFLVRTFGLPL